MTFDEMFTDCQSVLYRRGKLRPKTGCAMEPLFERYNFWFADGSVRYRLNTKAAHKRYGRTHIVNGSTEMSRAILDWSPEHPWQVKEGHLVSRPALFLFCHPDDWVWFRLYGVEPRNFR